MKFEQYEKSTCRKILEAETGHAVFGMDTVNVDGKGKLLQLFCDYPAADTCGSYFLRSSNDNGKTWSVPVRFSQPAECEDGIWKQGESSLYRDPDNGAIIVFFNYERANKNGHTPDRNAYLRIFYRLSTDNGKSFSTPTQLIVEGHDAINWAPGIMYGKNSALVSFNAPLKIGEEIILPAQAIPIGTDYSGRWQHHHYALCFRGKWIGKISSGT